MRKLFHSVAVVGLLAVASAQAAVPTRLLGDVVPVTEATRTIPLDMHTHAVNVKDGDVVRFTHRGQEFAFRFDGAPNVTHVDLQRVAPAGMLEHKVIAYIEPDAGMGGGRHGRVR